MSYLILQQLILAIMNNQHCEHIRPVAARQRVAGLALYGVCLTRKMCHVCNKTFAWKCARDVAAHMCCKSHDDNIGSERKRGCGRQQYPRFAPGLNERKSQYREQRRTTNDVMQNLVIPFNLCGVSATQVMDLPAGHKRTRGLL